MPNQELEKANERLQKAKEIELKRRKVLKQTYERKINELKNRVTELEKDNMAKDDELNSINMQIAEAQLKLSNMSGRPSSHNFDENSG